MNKTVLAFILALAGAVFFGWALLAATVSSVSAPGDWVLPLGGFLVACACLVGFWPGGRSS